MEKEYWATQPHNEVILDQAYRTSADVYLIFGVNKSGEFYGYARYGILFPTFTLGLDLALITFDRMAGPILQSDTKVAWASRTNSPVSTRGERTNLTPSASSPDPPSTRIVFPLAENRFAESSPSPFLTPSPSNGRNPHSRFQPPASESPIPSPSGVAGYNFDAGELFVPGIDGDDLRTPNRGTVSAPAELHQLRRKITFDTPETKFSLDMVKHRQEHKDQQPSEMRTHSSPTSIHKTPFKTTRQAINQMRQEKSHEFRLDRTAPARALKHPPASASTGAGGQFSDIMGTIEEQRAQSGTPESMLDGGNDTPPPVAKETDEREGGPSISQGGVPTRERAEELPTWGEPFRLQWIKTESLPFYRTRHLRNPWNHDREIKVSRDGTELEPSVGQALLDEWDRIVEPPSTEKVTQQSVQGAGGGSRRQGRGQGGVVVGGQRGKR